MWIWNPTKLLLQRDFTVETVRNLSNKTAYFGKIHRKLYLRHYPTTLVQPDGSTYTIRHFEPRRIIKIPLDLSTVSEEERQRILENRKPKKKVEIEEEIIDDFDSSRYLKYIKRRA